MRKRLFNQQSEPRSRETQKTWWLSVKAKIMMALLALMLMSQGSLAQVCIKHNDTWYYTSDFATVAFGDGTVSYSTTTGVLTLNNATINGCIYSFGSLNIQLIGINTIDATDSCAIKRIVNPNAQHINIYTATFNGTGQLLAKTTVYTKCTEGFTSMNYNDGLNCLLGSTSQSAAFIATQVLGGGDGSSSGNAYLIKTPEHLQMLSDIFDSGLFDNGSGKYFKLANNINCASLSNFKPIFATNSFQGTFDGNYCVISNLTVGSNYSGNSGLFDAVDGGSIINLTLEKCNCSGSNYVGAVVAQMKSGSVTNVMLNGGTIIVRGRGSLAGALIGRYDDGTLMGNKYTYDVSVNGRTGYNQRGVGNNNIDVIGQYELDTRKVIVECGENGLFSPKEGSFYMIAGKTCYVAAGYDFTLVVTPNSNYQPTLTLSDASIAVTAVDKDANGSVSTEFTFEMPNDNVTATVAFALNIASTDYTATIANADYTATGSLVPTTVTLTDNTGNTITLTSNDFTVTGYTLNGEPVKAPDKAGTYLVSIQGTGSYSGVKTNITYTVNKINATVTAPTAKTLTYTGSAQELVNAGSATGGTLEYSLDGTAYGTAIPKGTDAKTYTVYYRVTADANHNDVAAASIGVTIGKANATVTAPTAKTLTYTGSAQELVNGGSATGGTLEYSLDGTTYGTAIPKGTDAKTYMVYYRVTADTNHNDVAATSISVTIGKASATVTAPTAMTGLVYTGSPQVLINAGNVTNGVMLYSLDNNTYSTTIPTGTNAGNYGVWYKVVGNTGYNDVAPVKLTVTIAKATVTVAYLPFDYKAKVGESFDEPSLTVSPEDINITYRSSDPEIATVDAQTGEVTLVAPGKVYIYAEFAGDENFNAASDYYVLTVLQRDIEPIDEDVTITWKDEDFFFINDEGNREEIKLINVVIYDVLFTLDISGDPSESDGYDETDHSVVLNHSVSNDLMNYIVTHGGDPGTDKYAEQYTGMTFKVPAGKGYVIIECKTDGEHVMMIKIGNLAPIGFNHTDIQKDSVFYECAAPTWVHVYNGGEVRSSNARVKSVHRSKKTKGQVRVYSVTRRSQKATGIEMINSDAFDETERWYDLQGNRINRPTKKGIYIQRGQKVVVR